jgi:hypothetical protein
MVRHSDLVFPFIYLAGKTFVSSMNLMGCIIYNPRSAAENPKYQLVAIMR